MATSRQLRDEIAAGRRDAALAARLRELSAGTVTPVKTGNIYRAERVEK